MTVKELIEILTGEVKEADREVAEIEFWVGEEQYSIERMSGWGLSPDVSIHLKHDPQPVLKPMTFKAEHAEMVAAKEKEICNSITGTEDDPSSQ